MQGDRYPKIHIRSKLELAKHLSRNEHDISKNLALINDVIPNKDQYWKDHRTMSKPGKWVRNSSNTKLGRLLKLIDLGVLRVHDAKLPDYIFGGISGRNHKAAATYLLGNRRKRILLKMDVSTFFEQVQYNRVYNFFKYKCQCSDKGSRILADLCCVPYGPKDKPENIKTIARGFPTSPRLAVWCNLDAFIKIERLARKNLKGKDPRVAIYVDDIAITASGASIAEMKKLYTEIKQLLDIGDGNQKLPLNDNKSKIVLYTGEMIDITSGTTGRSQFEHLGLRLMRNRLALGNKTLSKLSRLTDRHQAVKGKDKKIKRSRKSLLVYKKYIQKT